MRSRAAATFSPAWPAVARNNSSASATTTRKSCMSFSLPTSPGTLIDFVLMILSLYKDMQSNATRLPDDSSDTYISFLILKLLVVNLNLVHIKSIARCALPSGLWLADSRPGMIPRHVRSAARNGSLAADWRGEGKQPPTLWPPPPGRQCAARQTTAPGCRDVWASAAPPLPCRARRCAPDTSRTLRARCIQLPRDCG